MSSIQNLINTNPNCRIYVYMEDAEIANRFLMDAENEGFRFGDGELPTRRHISNIMAINEDRTINYVGFVGHMAYQAGESVGGKKLVKINYREYRTEGSDLE